MGPQGGPDWTKIAHAELDHRANKMWSINRFLRYLVTEEIEEQDIVYRQTAGRRPNGYRISSPSLRPVELKIKLSNIQNRSRYFGFCIMNKKRDLTQPYVESPYTNIKFNNQLTTTKPTGTSCNSDKVWSGAPDSRIQNRCRYFSLYWISNMIKFVIQMF